MNKKLIIIGSSISTALIIVIILTVTLVSSNLDANEPATNQTANDDPSVPSINEVVVRIGNSSLWALDIDRGNASFIIKDARDYFDSFDAYSKKTVYLGSSIAKQPIRSLSNVFPDLKQPGLWNAEKIAVDTVNAKVYALDSLVQKINIFDINSEYYNVVVADLNQLKDIAVDPIRGCLFILQSSGILKINFDGTSSEMVVNSSHISAFSLELRDGYIYWANHGSIVRLPYAEHKYEIVNNISKAVTSLAVLRENLFWINFDYDLGNTVLWSYMIRNGICDANLKKIKIEHALQIKAYSFNPYQVTNSCPARDCEHMCTMNQAGEAYCMCAIGWKLEEGRCIPITDFLIYVQGNFVRGRSLDFAKNVHSEAILPIKLNITSLSQHRAINFDYDARTHTLIYNDDWSMYRQNLKSAEDESKIIAGKKKFGLIMPAFDWISNNFYYINTNWVAIHYIGVAKMNSFNFSTAKTIIESYRTNDFTSLIVHPNQGYLFYSVRYDEYSKIFRTNLDGSGKVSINHNRSATVSDDSNILGIDYEENRLYWFDKNKTKLHHTTVEGLDLQTIDISFVKNPRTINIHEKYVYISSYTSIWRLDKKNGSNAIKVMPLHGDIAQPIYGAKIFSQNAQLINEDHPCTGNGGCARYCFGIPKIDDELNVGKAAVLQKVCACGDEEKLAPDGLNCVDRWSD